MLINGKEIPTMRVITVSPPPHVCGGGRRGGPSGGTTGGNSEGGPSEGGSSGGVEGSSRVRRESAMDYALEIESTELPPFDDIE